jgi:hypothetical protein
MAQRHAMADDLGRETVVLVPVGEYWCHHPASISYPTAVQQVDNARQTASSSILLSTRLTKVYNKACSICRKGMKWIELG